MTDNQVESEQPKVDETAEKAEEPVAEEPVKEEVKAEAEKPVEEVKAEAEKPVEEEKAKKPAKAKDTSAPSGKTLSKDELIAAVKNMTVLELADLVKALEEEFGVSAAPVAVAASNAVPGAAGAGTPAAADEEKTDFTVILKEIGENKISVIKAVRELTTLGLKEAKDLVESAPKAVKEGVNKEEAEATKAKLQEAGALVEVK